MCITHFYPSYQQEITIYKALIKAKNGSNSLIYKPISWQSYWPGPGYFHLLTMTPQKYQYSIVQKRDGARMKQGTSLGCLKLKYFTIWDCKIHKILQWRQCGIQSNQEKRPWQNQTSSEINSSTCFCRQVQKFSYLIKMSLNMILSTDVARFATGALENKLQFLIVESAFLNEIEASSYYTYTLKLAYVLTS